MSDQPSKDSKQQSEGPPLPPWAFKYIMNPLMKTILRSPLHGLVSGRLILLTFPGRKTGKEYTIPVGYDREGDALWVFTFSPWWKNMQEPTPVQVRLQGERYQATAEAVTDQDVIARRIVQTIKNRGAAFAKQVYRLDVESVADVSPDDPAVRAAAAGRVFIRIELGR